MPDPVSRLNSALEGRYSIEGELGRGGMATVYLAEDLKHGRKVAVKVIFPELVSVVGSERFLREIGIAARLRHPHILPLLDSGDAGGLLYYAMPQVEGGSLRDRLRREKQLPIDEAVHITGEVADALSHAHSQGVIHRDIKPSNIMLDEGHAVVTDFGIALVVHGVSTERLTASGLSPGSPEYMSPEQAAGDQLDAHRVLPVGRGDILEMLGELRTFGLLTGARGRDHADLEAVVDAAQSVARCILSHEDVDEVEVNPLFVYSKGAEAVDARVFLGTSQEG